MRDNGSVVAERIRDRGVNSSKTLELSVSEITKKEETKTLATQIYLELTNICNFKCDFCPIQISKRPKGFMDFALFEKAAKEAARDGIAEKISFHVMGEPLLYPRIMDAIGLVKVLGLKSDLTTNGSLLTKEVAEKLVQSGLNCITISLETVDATEHQCRGIGLSHKEYYLQILDAVRILAEGGTDVTISMMNTGSRKYFSLSPNMGVSQRETVFAEKIQKLAYDIRETLGNPVSMKDCKKAARRTNIGKPARLKIAKNVSIYIQMLWDWGNAFSSGKIYESRFGQCGYMLENIGVLNDGTVTLCCGDFKGKTAIGNIKKSSMAEILGSDHAKRIRDGKSKNRLTHPQCRKCMGGRNPLEALIKGWLSIRLFKKLHPLYCPEIDLFTNRDCQ